MRRVRLIGKAHAVFDAVVHRRVGRYGFILGHRVKRTRRAGGGKAHRIRRNGKLRKFRLVVAFIRIENVVRIGLRPIFRFRFGGFFGRFFRFFRFIVVAYTGKIRFLLFGRCRFFFKRKLLFTVELPAKIFFAAHACVVHAGFNPFAEICGNVERRNAEYGKGEQYHRKNRDNPCAKVGNHPHDIGKHAANDTTALIQLSKRIQTVVAKQPIAVKQRFFRFRRRGNRNQMRQNGDRSDKPGIDTGFGLQTAVLHIVFPEQSLDNQANRQKGRACGKQAAQKPHQIADKAHFFGNDKADSQKQAEKQQYIRHIIIGKGAFEVTAFFERFNLFF